MLNNKGQSLVLFVIILPILLLILILVLDIGKVISLKKELNNINEIAMNYGLDNLNKESLEDELYKLIKLNKNDIDNVEISIDNEKIYIKMDEKIDGIFTNFIDIPIFNINLSYVGYTYEGANRIERMGE